MTRNTSNYKSSNNRSNNRSSNRTNNRYNSYNRYKKNSNRSSYYKKNYKNKRRKIYIKDRFAEKYPYNQYIRAETLRVIDDKGENLGVMEKYKALQLAREKETDIVIIAPNAKPPVAKLIDINSFKYQIQKKEKLAKKGQKKNKTKEVKFSPLIAQGDLDRKLESIRKFADKGYTVKVTVMRKRRVTKEMFDKFYNELLTLIKNCCTILNTQAKGRDAHILVKSTENAKN